MTAAGPGALAGRPETEAACAVAFPDRDGLDDLHVGLVIAAAALDDAIEAHAGTLRPLTFRPSRDVARPHAP